MLAEARDKTAGLLRMVRAGTDPLQERDARAAEAAAKVQAEKVQVLSFKAVAAAYIAAHEAGWRNAKHRAQWASTLEAYAYPHMGDLPAAAVATGHVMAALEPIWRTKPETANRLRGRIEAVLDYAKARGWRDGENPARWRGHVAPTCCRRAGRWPGSSITPRYLGPRSARSCRPCGPATPPRPAHSNSPF